MAVIINDFEVIVEPEPAPEPAETPAETPPAPPAFTHRDIADILRHDMLRSLRIRAH